MSEAQERLDRLESIVEDWRETIRTQRDRTTESVAKSEDPRAANDQYHDRLTTFEDESRIDGASDHPGIQND